MERIFKFCEEKKLTPNQLYVLLCVSKKHQPKNLNVFSELRNLNNSEFLTAEYEITEKGKDLIKEYEKSTLFVHIPADGEIDYIAQYLEMFPKGKLPSGKSARVNRKDIERTFTWFFKNYNYSWDIVLQATAHYLDTYEVNNYLYMRNSQYFIGKTNPDKTKESELANYCELILSGGYEEGGPELKENVV